MTSSAAASDEFLTVNIQLALGSSNCKLQESTRHHILWHPCLVGFAVNDVLPKGAWPILQQQHQMNSLLPIVNWPLAPATTSMRKPEGITSCNILPGIHCYWISTGPWLLQHLQSARNHKVQYLACYSLLPRFNWPLAAPAPTSCKKPQGITSCNNLPRVGFAIHDCPFQRRLTLHGICPGSSHNSDLA